METQSAVVTPVAEDGCVSYRVVSSTQNASGVCSAVASALGVSQARVFVDVKRLGGGFGACDLFGDWY